MNPLQLRRILFRWTPLVLALAVVGAGVAWIATRNQPPQYQAIGRVLVLGQVEASALSLTPGEIITTDAALMTQPALLKRVSQDLSLSYTTDQLASEILVSQEGQTELIDVTVTDTSAVRAAQIANAVMSDFVTGAQSQSAAVGQQAVSQLQQQVAAARQQVQADQLAVASAQRAQSGVPAAQAQLDADNAHLADLTAQLNQVQAQQQQTGKSIDIASPAVTPPQPLPSHRVANMALGAFGGVLLGIILALALQYLDQGLTTEEEVRTRLSLPTLGVIPSFHPSGAGRKNHRDATQAGEAYRRLRTSILFSSLDQPIRSIVVTSVHAGEGKTRTAANLAGVMAAAGERVLLVDADLRRPMQHGIFGEPLHDGVSELLLRAAHSEPPKLNGLHRTAFENLSLLTAGVLPPNPSELLASRMTAGVLRQLEQQFDLVIIDTPPAQAVTDAVSLAACAGATILVIEAGSTKAGQAQHTIATLRSVGANVVGVVLNKARRRSLTSYAYYYYEADASKRKPAPTGPLTQVAAWKPLGDTRAKVPSKSRSKSAAV